MKICLQNNHQWIVTEKQNLDKDSFRNLRVLERLPTTENGETYELSARIWNISGILHLTKFFENRFSSIALKGK